MKGYELILSTGRIIDFEMACDSLKEKGIPFIRQEENISGLKEAYVQPVMGPGNFFNLLVPNAVKEDAINTISELPIDVTTEPDLWHFNENEKSKRNWKIYIWFVLAVSAVMLVVNLLKI